MNKKTTIRILSITLTLLLIIGIVCLLLFIVDTPYRNSRRLQKAIVENDVEKVQELLSNGIDPNIPEFYPGKWLRFLKLMRILLWLLHASTEITIL